jgi:dTMP kinase
MPTLLTRGVLIAFEGIDGAGKTTQASLLARHCREMGLEVVESKEPTNGQWGRKVRNSAETGRLSPEDELELFIADRREHVQTLVGPALDARKVVIVDRYYFSTAAYQGARGMDPEEILALNEQFAPQPDILFLLTIDPSLGRARIASRGDRANLFEGERELAASAEIFDRISRGYLRRLNGHLTIPELEHAILYGTGKLLEDLVERPASDASIAREALLEIAKQVEQDDSLPAEAKAQALLDRVARSS